MRERVISLSVAAVLGVVGSLSLADDARAQSSPINPIGKVISATGAVSIEHGDAAVVQAKLPGNATQAKVGDFVYQGDTVSTGADSAVGITFADGTAFNVASNARMMLSEFVYDPKGRSNSSFFNLTKGAFTFIAGRVATTGDMKVNTPVATMGIRGTTPRVEISEDGTVTFNTLVEDKKAIEKIIGTVPEAGKKQRQGVSITPKPRPANTVASPTDTPK
jgi:hypothetical protein